MSDLISRSDVNNLIDELEVYTCGRPNTMKVEISVLQLQSFINKLKNIPTAYDINKVVEELEGINGLIRGRKTCSECEYITYCFYGEQLHKVAIDKAIEIVKQGDVSDDVCEWKQTSTAKYKTSCGYKLEEYFDTNACYCKQCGKKIKVV